MFDNFLNVCKDVTKTARKIPQGEYLTDGIYKIFDQGKPYVGGYCNTADGVATDYPYIIFGDHTRVIKYIEEPCYIGADGVKLLKVHNDDFIPKYVYYAMLANPVEHQGYSRHFKLLKETRIRKNEKSMQIAIIKELDKINQAISLKESELNHLDDLVKSRFIEMFGEFETNSMNWEIKPFSHFASIDGNMTSDFEKYADYPHIGVGNIEKDTGNLIEYKTIREDNVISGKYLFTPEHIIYSKIRPNLNKVALPTFDGLCSADAYPILPNKENCNRIFLAIAMRSEYFLGYILQFSSRANMPKVNRKEISGFTMPLPPLSLQNEFAEFVKVTDKSKFVCHFNPSIFCANFSHFRHPP